MAYIEDSCASRDDGDLVGMSGAVVIGVDQVHSNCFYIFRDEIAGRTLKSKRKLNLEL